MQRANMRVRTWSRSSLLAETHFDVLPSLEPFLLSGVSLHQPYETYLRRVAYLARGIQDRNLRRAELYAVLLKGSMGQRY